MYQYDPIQRKYMESMTWDTSNINTQNDPYGVFTYLPPSLLGSTLAISTTNGAFMIVSSGPSSQIGCYTNPGVVYFWNNITTSLQPYNKPWAPVVSFFVNINYLFLFLILFIHFLFLLISESSRLLD